MVVSGMALAQRGEPVVIPLWPNGAPNDNHLTGEEGHPDPRSVNSVSKPELWVYPAFRPNGTVIIACPGGGYVYLEIEKGRHCVGTLVQLHRRDAGCAEISYAIKKISVTLSSVNIARIVCTTL